jgi:hypothetical protein
MMFQFMKIARGFSREGMRNIIGGGEPDELDLFRGYESLAVDTRD